MATPSHQIREAGGTGLTLSAVHSGESDVFVVEPIPESGGLGLAEVGTEIPDSGFIHRPSLNPAADGGAAGLPGGPAWDHQAKLCVKKQASITLLTSSLQGFKGQIFKVVTDSLLHEERFGREKQTSFLQSPPPKKGFKTLRVCEEFENAILQGGVYTSQYLKCTNKRRSSNLHILATESRPRKMRNQISRP